jgi:hypothetical protein
MTTTNQLTRQLQRCGHEPWLPTEHVNGQDVYRHPDHGNLYPIRTIPKMDAGICAGYGCELPEVHEVRMAYPQWKERTLTHHEIPQLYTQRRQQYR